MSLVLSDPGQAIPAEPALVANSPRWSFIDDARPISRRAIIIAFLAITLFYALLWSPHWFPLADSALYLCLGRSLAEGHGFTFMGLPYKRITPGTPLLLSWVMEAGGGIGAIHFVYLLLMLGALLLMFLSLRRWTSDRIALVSVLATAATFWVFRNVTLIMTEPPFLFCTWLGIYLLSLTPTSGNMRRWTLLIFALVALVCAWQNRWAATLFFFPGLLAAFWMANRSTMTMKTRAIWIGAFALVFGLLTADFDRKPEGPDVTEDPFIKLSGGRGERAKANEELADRFETKVFQDVKGPWYKKAAWVPVLAGRWMNELFVAPAGSLFPKARVDRDRVPVMNTRQLAMMSLGIAAALGALVCSIIGCVILLRRGQWWLVGLATYAVPFWLQWGARVHPRYPVPVTPVIFILLCTGFTWLLSRIRFSPRLLRAVPAAIVGLIILGNIGVYAVEFYIRHLGPRDFYDYGKQGFIAELVDIGAYLREKSGSDELIFVNAGGLSQRVGHFFTGRRIEQPLTANKRELNVKDPNDLLELHNYLSKVAGRYAIVFSTEHPIPEWHLPLNSKEQKSWWRLYELDPDTGDFHRVIPPKNRDYVRSIPPLPKAE